MAEGSTTSNSDFFTYECLPGPAIDEGTGTNVTLNYPPSPGSNFTNANNKIVGFVRYDLDTENSASLRLQWYNGTDPGKPVFLTDAEVAVTQGTDYYDCVFEKPDSGDPDSVWELKTDSPGFKLQVKVKRK
ncbi:MAG: hypothetical protein AAF799_37135 [Myxococcota bacterium]